MDEPDTTSTKPISTAGRLPGPVLLLLALAAVLAICWLLYWLEADRILDQQKQRESVRVNLLNELLRSELRPAINDVRMLADGDGLRSFLEAGRSASLLAAVRRALFVSQNHAEYDQIRFIDEKGDEVLRVNQGGSVVPAADLQNKVNSPYFQKASALPPGSVYISDFDLTIENGAVVRPLKPVLRFAVPVFDAAGRRRGIYLISLLATNMVERLLQAGGAYSERLRLLDATGYWLRAADPQQEWGFSLPEREQFTLARTNPTLWTRVRREAMGQSGDANGLFTWQWLLPESIAPSVQGHLMSENTFLVVASQVSRSELAALTAGLRHVMGLVVAVLAPLTLLIGWLLRARRKVLTELRSMNQVLELRVRERTQGLHTQLQRMNLLERTTRAIGEHQDLSSILNVVIRTLEEQLSLDFCCVCHYDPTAHDLTVTAVGVASGPLAAQLAMSQQAHVPIDENGLSRCVRGQLVHEADISEARFPFPQRLAGGGLRALVAAPLQIESKVFGVLIAARREPHSFSSSDCEFLRQLSEHVALAAHQAQLHEALKGAYEDLRSTQQTVMQQERLRVLGQMASGIAHDINNAISPIMLYTDALLEREPGLSAQARRSLQTIQQAVSDVAETVARMREFYRPRETQTELHPVQLNALVLQLRDLTRARWEAMPQQRGIVIDVQLELAERMRAAQGIENEIREALINLVFNAVDAMPTGGRLIIRTRPDGADRVCVEVVDTGMGMDEDTRRRSLEPFFTTKGDQGTGLGLAMVYGVMQRHGGEVDIESAPGAGTTVRLTFAAADASPALRTEPEIPVPTGLAVLLVDDDPILLRSLREILELDGHRIVAADSGQGGINTFRASLRNGGLPFSVVITDLGMPHVDGREVAATVKLVSPATPVILLTGWGERLLSEGHTIPHVDRVLSKPPRLRDLRKALGELTMGQTREQGLV